MPAPYAREFTPELNQEVLASALNDIDLQEQTAEGQARQEGASGGLIAKPTTGLRIADTQAQAERNRADTISRFNMDVAGKKYSERMTDEARQFQDYERQKQDEFTKQMAEMGYEHENAMDSGALHAAQQGQLLGLFGGALSAGVGGFAGGYGRKMAGG